jgi:hypothetical protein
METKYFEEVSSNGVIHKILFSEVLFQGVSDFQEVKVGVKLLSFFFYKVLIVSYF